MISLFFLAGCEGGTPEAIPEDRTTESDPDTSCPNEEQTLSRAAAEIGIDRVDVTGDGTRDEVRLHFDGRGQTGCQAFLAVETEAGATTGPVWEQGRAGGLPRPSLFGYVELDDAAPAEIILIEAAGASTQFAGLYALSGRAFELIEFPASDNGLFPFGGSVGHIEAVGCDHGELVALQAVPGDTQAEAERQAYEVTRRSYRLEGTALREIDVERDVVPLARFDSLPEFSGGPFATCPAP